MSHEDSEVRLDSSMIIETEPATSEHLDLVALLNDLYAAETSNFIRYIETWEPYTNISTLQLRRLARNMMRASFDHADRLAHLIESHQGTAIQGAFPQTDAFINYSDWSTVLPILISDKQASIARYDAAIGILPNIDGGDAVDPALKQLRHENTSQLDELVAWADNLNIIF